VWARKDRRVARSLAVLGLVAMFVLVPAIRLTRSKDKSLAEGLRDLRPLAFLTEAGGSMYPLVATHELVTAKDEPLWFGRSYGAAVRAIVPNVSFTFTRAVDREEEDAPGRWLTKRIDPWLADHGGGYGFSSVAEPYLNFGWIGVIVMFAALGYLTRTMDRWLGRSPYWGAVAAASFGFLLWTVRNDASGLFRPIAYSCLLVIAARFLRRSGALPEEPT
jgi:hypothetical protein